MEVETAVEFWMTSRISGSMATLKSWRSASYVFLSSTRWRTKLAMGAPMTAKHTFKIHYT